MPGEPLIPITLDEHCNSQEFLQGMEISQEDAAPSQEYLGSPQLKELAE